MRENLDKLKLPENAAKEFFNDLAEADHCVCRDEMSDARREAILAQRDAYLGKEDQGVLNAIKGAIKDTANRDPSSYREQLEKQLARLRHAVRDRDLVQGELDALERRRPEGGDQELTALGLAQRWRPGRGWQERQLRQPEHGYFTLKRILP